MHYLFHVPLGQLTWYLNFQQGKDFDQEYGNPAEGVREHDEEKAVCHCHILVQPSTQLCGIDACLIDGVKHAGVGHDNDEEGHQVKSYKYKHKAVIEQQHKA